MKRTALGALIAIVALFGSAMARGLPQQATVAVVNDLGVLVGTGSIHDGTLEIVLSDAADGFVTLQFTDALGHVVRVQALIPRDGSLHIVRSGGAVPARAFAADNALALEVHSRGAVEAQSAPSAPEVFDGSTD